MHLVPGEHQAVGTAMKKPFLTGWRVWVNARAVTVTVTCS